MYVNCTITLAIRSFLFFVNPQFDPMNPLRLFYRSLTKAIIGGFDLVFPVISLNVLDRGVRSRVGINSHLFSMIRAGDCKQGG